MSDFEDYSVKALNFVHPRDKQEYRSYIKSHLDPVPLDLGQESELGISLDVGLFQSSESGDT